METNPQGQLGGLETSDAVRRRLATESRSFVCSTCGRSNADLIKEAEEAAAAAEAQSGGAGSKREEVEIPKELRMGWKDEMKATSATNSGASTPQPRRTAADGTTSGDSDADSAAALAEGFVQTGPPQAAAAGGTAQAGSALASTRQQSSLSQRQQVPPVQSPQPTRTAPLPNPNPLNHHQQGGAVVAGGAVRAPPAPPVLTGAQTRLGAAYEQQQQQRRRATAVAHDNSINEGVPVWVDRAIVAVGAVVLALLVRILFS
jgi:ubiquitin-conjugating enzyme E2 J1